ncbi:DUF4145 domain-containing protein [Massilia sp. DJPM01]|uniref:DUF4145 domain-containing protein n=1 Tax=Massilia sp. DJPM01 TaxID=3024404 RepID=UPI00259EE38C|nr:DUF4145 domain-containing protein [Massilia sp. DJPM01]MDM5181765.1 DUF4145 domain-containing protein [Massilia sp. DJPM01]
MKKTKAHCNSCGGVKNHEVLHSETSSWSDDEHQISGSDQFDTLKCGGCDAIKLRHKSSFSESDEDEVTYFPPAIFRKPPAWFDKLRKKLKGKDRFVHRLLKEVYVALQHDLPALAVMGVRALLEAVMISKVGDQGTFAHNIAEFERLGYVSRLERARLEAILEAGHATIHRDYEPETDDVITALNVAEQIVETVYLHDDEIAALSERVPPRAPRAPRNKKPSNPPAA